MNASEILRRAEALEKDLIALRRVFHADPELGWKETETSKKIEAELLKLGCSDVKRGYNGTESGVTANIVGKAAGPCVALRADIDALPIQENVDVPFASKKPGVMHACGHDGHTAILLGVAKVLSAMKAELPGTVRLLFQPAEEAGIGSGAPALIKEGALEGVSAVVGIHIMSDRPFGVFSVRKGPTMASADIWEVQIQGKGGHGSAPHQSVDPTVAVAHIISMMQTVVSREMNPLESVVVSIGKVESGTVVNAIPDKAMILGNVRTTDRNTRNQMEARMRRIVDGVSSALRCESKLTYTQIYPVTVNDPAVAETLGAAAREVLGGDKIAEFPITMGSEDFSYYGEKVPAAFGILGMGDPAKGTDKPHHSPIFNMDEAILVKGTAVLANFAWKFLTAGK